jgi:hypothetical protein
LDVVVALLVSAPLVVGFAEARRSGLLLFDDTRSGFRFRECKGSVIGWGRYLLVLTGSVFHTVVFDLFLAMFSAVAFV